MVHYGGNDGLSILFDDLKCTGMENSLLNCHRTSVNEIDCTHLEDVGVVCTGMYVGVVYMYLHVGVVCMYLHVGMVCMYLHVGVVCMYLHVGVVCMYLHVGVVCMYLHVGVVCTGYVYTYMWMVA